MTLPGTTNGVAGPRTEQEAERILTGKAIGASYRSSYAYMAGAITEGDSTGLATWAFFHSLESMICHDSVKLPYNYYKSGVAAVEISVRARNDNEAEFARKQLLRFWERSLDQAQLHYDYGWGCFEPIYGVEHGLLHYQHIEQYHPLDSWALSGEDGNYVGASVRGWAGGEYAYGERWKRPSGADFQRTDVGGALGGTGVTGGIRLWGPGKWPAKALWLVHDRRWNKFYGRSQLISAFKPYRRLAARDGAEEVTDAAFYKGAYAGALIYYPPEDFRRTAGGVDYDAGRSAALELCEEFKAGTAIALPNTYYANGKRKWEFEKPAAGIDVAPQLVRCDALYKQIARGIGVPLELIEASETGSGWSGRKVPLLGFYVGQLREARNIVHSFGSQILNPLMRWNFGRESWAEAQVKVVLPGDLGGAPGPGQSGQPGAPGQPGQPGQGAVNPNESNPLAGLLGGGPGPAGAGEGAELSTLARKLQPRPFRRQGITRLVRPAWMPVVRKPTSIPKPAPAPDRVFEAAGFFKAVMEGRRQGTPEEVQAARAVLLSLPPAELARLRASLPPLRRAP